MTVLNPINQSGATPVQDFGGARLKNVADPTGTQDAMTQHTATSTAGGIPRVYRQNTVQTNVWEYENSVVVASGTVTFNLTTDGTSTGTAIFSTAVFTESINITIFDATNSYVYSAPTVAGNRKTITFTVNKVGLSLGIIVFVSAANGTTVNLTVKGN